MGLLDVGRVVASSLHNAGLPELAAVAARLGLGFPSQTVVFAVEVVDPYTFGIGSEPAGRRRGRRARGAGQGAGPHDGREKRHARLPRRRGRRRTSDGAPTSTDVTEVRIRAGAAFSPVALRQAYEMLTLGTPLQGSRLLVEPGQDERESSA